MAGSATKHFAPKFDASLLVSDEEDVVYEEKSNLLGAQTRLSPDDKDNMGTSSLIDCKKKVSMCCALLLVVCAVASSFAIGTSLVYKYKPSDESNEVRDNNVFEILELAEREFGDPIQAKNQRLPQNVYPRKYNVHFNVDLETLSYTGHVVILFDCLKTTNAITLHANQNLTMEETLISVMTEEEHESRHIKLKILSIKYQKELSQMIIGLNRELDVEAVYAVSFRFRNVLSPNKFGFFSTSYKDSTGHERPLAFTMFEPSGARDAYPCFDEPALKATFDVSIEHDSLYHAASNMPKTKTVKIGDDRLLTTFERTPKMSTYLLSVAVTDYVHKVRKSNSEVVIRGFEHPSMIEQMTCAVDVTLSTINYLEKILDMLYPLPKIDIFPIPNYGFNGAEEGWGLMTFSENLAVYNPTTDLRSTKLAVTSVTTHEIAHQYFGDLVSIPWWTDLWLKEALAEYIAVYVTSQLHKEYHVLEISVLTEVLVARSIDQFDHTHPISNKVADAAQTTYDSIPYQKGSAFFRMLAVHVGQHNFFQGLARYLKRYKYSIATQENMWSEISRSSSTTHVADMAKSWIYQKGYPLVTITKSTDGKHLVISQERMIIDRKVAKDTSSVWYIPLTIKTSLSSSQSSKLLVTNSTVTVAMASSKWFKANSDWKGFYRVNYDNTNWAALIQQLSTDHTVFSVMDRANLVDDSFQLYRSGRIGADNGLGTYCYLKNENAFAPFYVATENFQYLERFQHAKFLTLLRKFALNSIEAMLTKFGWTHQKIYHDEELHGHLLKIAIILGHTKTISEGTSYFNKLRTSPLTDVAWRHPLRYYMIQSALKDGNEDNWNFVWSVYVKTTSQSDQLHLLRALAVTRSKVLLNRLLSHVVDNTIPMAFQGKVIARVASNPIGTDLTWDVVSKNWLKFYNRHKASPVFVGSACTNVAKYFTTQAQLQKLVDFLRTNPNGLTKQLSHEALEMTRVNIDFLKAEETNIYNWLSDKLLGNSCTPIRYSS